ncbi:transforming growth factor-beta receptor type 3-like protein [Alligator mississippiensis]|uniref:transforming growth factor-beta receptor type 3-like protein n=1 Tax=Alligator mississippiensis TaxID=8496 RepID=UPI002877B5CB|nr:transforming growth factor-beta receptor type 3-like protein [Alligator mississippiensis]
MGTTPGHLLEDEPEVLETIKVNWAVGAGGGPGLMAGSRPGIRVRISLGRGRDVSSAHVGLCSPSWTPLFPGGEWGLVGWVPVCLGPLPPLSCPQASLAAFDAALSFSLQLCALSPRSAAQPPGPHVLVRGGCAAEPGVVLAPPERAGLGPARGRALPPGCQERRRLSFPLRPRSNHSIQFLHCRLALCAQRPRAHGLPQCPSPGGACDVSAEEAMELGGGRGQRTITKPIIVTVGGPGPAPSSAPWWRPVKLQRPAAPRARPGPPPKAPAAARGLELPVVVAISFSAFVIGVSLAGGVWLLHGRTGPAETPARSPLPAAQPAPRA